MVIEILFKGSVNMPYKDLESLMVEKTLNSQIHLLL